MELPKILDFLSHKKSKEQIVAPAAVENNITHLETEFQNHHQAIEENIASATQQPVPEGSSIPPANVEAYNPVTEMLVGPKKENILKLRQTEIDATLPKDYETTKTGFGNAWDRNLLGKDGMTIPDEFLAKQAEKAAAVKALQDQVAEEVKKAA